MLGNCYSQWYQQNSGTTVDFTCVRFINENTGWVCGNGGVILKTTNAGKNWFFNNNSVPNKPYSKIFPIDSNIVYCIGYFRTIIKSTNGGNNWQIIRDGPFAEGNSYRACYFINENTGWISGTGFTVLKTTDGGSSFDSIPMGNIGFVRDLYFRNSMEGLFCDDNGRVRKTTNGGYNWFSINIPVGFNTYFFHNFSFINDLTGWTATDDKKLFKTTDFGYNWDSLPSIPIGYNSIHCIFFSSLSTGWTGGTGYGSMFKTTNGGINWGEENIPNALGGTHSIYFTNDSIGWKIGNLGRIYHTTNSGQPLFINLTNNGIIPANYELHQNYPNPFNTQTNIEFDITESGIYKLEIFDILGRKVEELFNKNINPGSYRIKYDAEKLNSGTYFYRLQSEKMSRTKSFLFIK